VNLSIYVPKDLEAPLEAEAAKRGKSPSMFVQSLIRARLVTFFRELTILPFDRLCGEQFARLKAELLVRGQPIPDFDVAIAATAVATGRTLVSADAHMEEIGDLARENWALGKRTD